MACPDYESPDRDVGALVKPRRLGCVSGSPGGLSRALLYEVASVTSWEDELGKKQRGVS